MDFFRQIWKPHKSPSVSENKRSLTKGTRENVTAELNTKPKDSNYLSPTTGIPGAASIGPRTPSATSTTDGTVGTATLVGHDDAGLPDDNGLVLRFEENQHEPQDGSNVSVHQINSSAGVPYAQDDQTSLPSTFPLKWETFVDSQTQLIQTRVSAADQRTIALNLRQKLQQLITTLQDHLPLEPDKVRATLAEILIACDEVSKADAELNLIEEKLGQQEFACNKLAPRALRDQKAEREVYARLRKQGFDFSGDDQMSRYSILTRTDPDADSIYKGRDILNKYTEIAKLEELLAQDPEVPESISTAADLGVPEPPANTLPRHEELRRRLELAHQELAYLRASATDGSTASSEIEVFPFPEDPT